jgi:hypothetical protein
MNSASRGLRPTVGLRRPGRCLLRRRRPTPGAERLGRPISIGVKALRRPGRCLLRRRRPTPGAQRPGRPISIGVKAFGRRSACAPNEFGLQGPSANGRPAPTGRCLLRRRRPTPGAQRPGRPISIGVKAFGRRSACAPNEFGLGRPSADGRPAPTGKVSFASAEADARRAAPWKADFNRQERLQPRPRWDREDRGCGAESPSPRNDRRCHRDPSPERRRRAQEGAARGRKGSRPAAPSKPPMGPSRRVCPKIVGQLLAVVLQGGQARQNRDTPEPPHPRVRARSGDGMPLKGSPPGCSPPG